MRSRYYIVIDGVKIEVFPLDVAKVKKVTAKEKDQAFYRTKLSGSIVLNKDGGYAHLLQLEQSEDRCKEIKFVVENDCKGFFDVDWQGYFSCNDVSWNLSRCTASFTPKPDDKYRPILENYGKAINILPGTTPVTATARLDFDGEFDFLFTNWDETPATDPDTWALFIEMNYWVDGSLVSKGGRYNGKIYYRVTRTAPYVDGAAPELEGWSLVDEDPDAQTAKYAKQPDLYNFKPYNWNFKGNFDLYPELVQVPCGDAFDTARYIDVTSYLTGANMQNGCLNVFRKLSEDRYVKVLWEFGSFTFSRNRAFADVLGYLVEQTVGSTFLPADTSLVSRFFSEPTNYVTGRPNTLTGLQVASVSDVVGYNSTEAATKAEISLKSFLDSLRNMFRVFWDVTAEGVIRLEHESFYQLQGEEDLTVYPRQLQGTAAYTYEKADMPRYQRLQFAAANNADFEQGEIEYGGVCVVTEEGQDTEEVQVTDVVTDLEYLIVSGGGTAQGGLVFMLTSGGQVLRERGDLTGYEYPNAGLSAANLVADYYTHNRVLENGAVNGRMRVFQSVNKTKKQVQLTVPACCKTFNPYARYISTLGDNAALDEMSQSLLTGTVELTLLHETTGSGGVVLGRQFDDSFDDSFN